MLSFITNPLVVGFVFLAAVGIFVFIMPIIRALVFKKKIAKLIRWSGENPNALTTEAEPAKIFAELKDLRKKLKGDWPRFIKRPRKIIGLLIHIETYPASCLRISGLALNNLLEDGVPEVRKEVTLCLDFEQSP